MHSFLFLILVNLTIGQVMFKFWYLGDPAVTERNLKRLREEQSKIKKHQDVNKSGS